MFHQRSKYQFLSTKSTATFSLLLLLILLLSLKIKGAILNVFSGGSDRTFTFLQREEHNMTLIPRQLRGTAKAFNEWTFC